jgi:solute carrier family 25 carnitine/acylcarnitine transporter 20/29
VTPGNENIGIVLVAGGLCGICTWAIHFPIDSVKSLIQADPMEGGKNNSFMIAARQNLARPGGWRNFYKGYVPCLLRGFPCNAATFVAFEGTMGLIGGKDF